MSLGIVDVLGLSWVILCNDGFVKRLEELEWIVELYKGMMEYIKNFLWVFYELLQIYWVFGDVFFVIGVWEFQLVVSEVFVKFVDVYCSIEKFGIWFLKIIKLMLMDLNMYFNKVILDICFIIKKYLDVKFEYLLYCLKVKEMDDEEYSCIVLGEFFYWVSIGNYEYCLILCCCQEVCVCFFQMCKDVLEKMELLDQKYVQDIVFQLQCFVFIMFKYYNDCYVVLWDVDVFFIEVDLVYIILVYGFNQEEFIDGEEEEEEEDMVVGELFRDI